MIQQDLCGFHSCGYRDSRDRGAGSSGEIDFTAAAFLAADVAAAIVILFALTVGFGQAGLLHPRLQIHLLRLWSSPCSYFPANTGKGLDGKSGLVPLFARFTSSVESTESSINRALVGFWSKLVGGCWCNTWSTFAGRITIVVDTIIPDLQVSNLA